MAKVGAGKDQHPELSWKSQWKEPYDWATLLASAGTNSRKENVQAYFHSGLEVAQIPGKGLGIRTKEALSQGELLLVEPAFASGAFQEAVLTACQRLADSPNSALRKLQAQVCALNGGVAGHKEALCQSPVPVETWGDDLPVRALSLDEVRDRFATNAMASISLVEKPGGYVAPEAVDASHTALYPIASLVNHDCAPNCNRLPLGSIIAGRAARDVAAGEELTWFYTEVRCPQAVRRAELQRDWGFTCSCKRCVFESGLPPKTTKELNQCHQAFEALKLARQASEAELRRLVNEARRCAARGAKVAAERAWLMCSVFAVVAFEFANGLCSMGQYVEADNILGDIEKTYAQALPSSTMHANVAHCRSYVSLHHKSSFVQALNKSVHAHDMCFGGGVRTWRLLTCKALPAEARDLVMSLASQADSDDEPSSAHGQRPLNKVAIASAKGKAATVSEKGTAYDSIVTGDDSIVSQTTPSVDPHVVVDHPQVNAKFSSSSQSQNSIKVNILEGKLLRAAVQLEAIPSADSIELSSLVLRVGDQIWGLPFEVDPSTAQTSWSRKRGLLCLEASLASCDNASCGQSLTTGLGTLD